MRRNAIEYRVPSRRPVVVVGLGSEQGAAEAHDGGLEPEATLPGFFFEPLGRGELTYTVYNDSDATITIGELQFLPDSVFVPLADLMPNPIPGFGEMQPDFDLRPGGSEWFLIEGAGDFVLAEGSVFDTATREPISNFIEIHQIPEPTTWMLIVLAPLLYRRRPTARFSTGG